jgi:hypothetical protein
LRPYNSCKLEFRSKRCAFIGYSNLQKGYKCLDISSGRVYITRDVVFDENIFPFSELHSNAGAHLRAELLLLPPELLAFTRFDQGGVLIDDQLGANPTNPAASDFSGTQDGVHRGNSSGTDSKGDYLPRSSSGSESA